MLLDRLNYDVIMKIIEDYFVIVQFDGHDIINDNEEIEIEEDIEYGESKLLVILKSYMYEILKLRCINKYFKDIVDDNIGRMIMNMVDNKLIIEVYCQYSPLITFELLNYLPKKIGRYFLM